MPRSTPDEAIRAYLEFRAAGPDSLPDDPVDRLLLGARLERGFVEHAASWARQNGISGAAFAQEGVPADVLQRAGLREQPEAAGYEVLNAIRSAIPARQPFSEDGLMARTGASRKDVRMAITEQMRLGKVEPFAVSELESSGRIMLYRRVSRPA